MSTNILSQARRTQPETHWQLVAAASVPQTELLCYNVEPDQAGFPHIMVQIWWQLRLLDTEMNRWIL